MPGGLPGGGMGGFGIDRYITKGSKEFLRALTHDSLVWRVIERDAGFAILQAHDSRFTVITDKWILFDLEEYHSFKVNRVLIGINKPSILFSPLMSLTKQYCVVNDCQVTGWSLIYLDDIYITDWRGSIPNNVCIHPLSLVSLLNAWKCLVMAPIIPGTPAIVSSMMIRLWIYPRVYQVRIKPVYISPIIKLHTVFEMSSSK